MANMITYREYRRKVFNTAMLECFSRIHASTLGLDPKTPDCPKEQVALAKKMCDAFFSENLKLNKSTIDQTKKALGESVTFIKDCMNICEAIAEDKMQVAVKNELDVETQEEIELSPEDEALIDKVFEDKGPQLQVDAVRDATVKALIAEDKKAQEIKDALSIAQSQVAIDSDPKAMEETVSRLNGRGPTSLMNAIMNQMTTYAVKDINEGASAPVSVGKVMKEHAEEIRDRAVMAYSLYETSSVFGIVKWTEADVREEARRIYFNR